MEDYIVFTETEDYTVFTEVSYESFVKAVRWAPYKSEGLKALRRVCWNQGDVDILKAHVARIGGEIEVHEIESIYEYNAFARRFGWPHCALPENSGDRGAYTVEFEVCIEPSQEDALRDEVMKWCLLQKEIDLHGMTPLHQESIHLTSLPPMPSDLTTLMSPPIPGYY